MRQLTVSEMSNASHAEGAVSEAGLWTWDVDLNCLHTCYLWHTGRKNDSVSCTHEQQTIAGEQQVQHAGYFLYSVGNYS